MYCPTERKHKVAHINSQSFGSLGAVAAWYRTARMVQHVMLSIFGYVIFVYVDDCFWVAPEFDQEGYPGVDTIANTFEYVVSELLGWRLDDEKSCVGRKIVLLGLEIEMTESESPRTLSPDKG